MINSVIFYLNAQIISGKKHQDTCNYIKHVKNINDYFLCISCGRIHKILRPSVRRIRVWSKDGHCLYLSIELLVSKVYLSLFLLFAFYSVSFLLW